MQQYKFVLLYFSKIPYVNPENRCHTELVSRSMSKMLKQVQHDKDVSSLEICHIPSSKAPVILNLFEYQSGRFEENLKVFFSVKKKMHSP